MEKHRPWDADREEKAAVRRQLYEEQVRARAETMPADQTVVDTRAIVQEHLKERARKAGRRKWGGRALIILGSVIVLGSCPFYAVSLIGAHTILAGLTMIAGGSALLAWKPRLKDANEALLIAMKYGNRLTAPRLALELDISFEKAEKIIQELVRNGIAEIDLDYNDPEAPITYKIKGL